MKTLAIIASLTGWGPLALAQHPINHGVPLAENRFGRLAMANYTGTVSWTWDTGMAVESATGTLTGGQFTCVSSHRSESGAYSANGPGLIEFSLGLDPESDDIVYQSPEWNRRMYSIQFACPKPGQTPQEARWSHPFETFKQPCGAFRAGATGLDFTGLPEELFGTRSERLENGDDTEHVSVTWRFCRGNQVCPPLPAPAPGQPPQPRPLPC